MKRFILPTLLTTLIACQLHASPSVEPTFEATVQSVGGDCNLPLLDFGSRTDEVAQVAGTPSAYRLYYAVNLPATYWKTGQVLTAVVRRATASEQSFCTTMGPAYPTVVIVSAQRN